MDVYRLSDGRMVEIRAIRPDDAARLRVTHAHLSPEAIYRRFLGAKPELSEADAAYLARVDGRDHLALAAVDGEEIVAVARCIRLAEDPEAAEYAIVVRDDYQRQGLGAALTGRLVQSAAARGIRRLRATALTENVAVRRLLARFAEPEGQLRVTRQGQTCELEIDLPAPRPALTGPARRAA